MLNLRRSVHSMITRHLWTIDMTWEILGGSNLPSNISFDKTKRLTSSPNNHKYFYSLFPSLPTWEVFNIQLRNNRGTLSLGQMKRSLLPQSLWAPALFQAPSSTVSLVSPGFVASSLSISRPRGSLFGHHKWLKPKRAAWVIGLNSTPPVACIIFVLHLAFPHFSGLSHLEVISEPLRVLQGWGAAGGRGHTFFFLPDYMLLCISPYLPYLWNSNQALA